MDNSLKHNSLGEKVFQNKEFQKILKIKNMLSWSLSLLIFFVYVCFILFIGFKPEIFARPATSGGIITIGIYSGIFVIIFSIIITGIYVYVVNGILENMTNAILKKEDERNV